jgi:hypothetical protein
MSKRRRKLDTSPAQLSLLDYLAQLEASKRPSNEIEGCADISLNLFRAMKRAAASCSKSSFQIAGELSHLTGREISKTTYDSWMAESKPGNRPPADIIPAFCRVTGSTEPLDVINEAAGVFGLPGPDALRAEIQKYTEQERRARAEKRKRELFLKEIERRKA